jgi:PIN domain nuclease of toxin-antitoxin system
VRLLLDTHAALWWLSGDAQLAAGARRAIAAAENVRLFSVASGWEIAIKTSLGKLRLPRRVDAFLERHLPLNRIELLAITLGDLKRVESLPFHHRDPFDRMLAAQALGRDLAIVSADPIFERYGARRIWKAH